MVAWVVEWVTLFLLPSTWRFHPIAARYLGVSILPLSAQAHNERMRSKLVPTKRIALPPLHLHLSEDGTSPLPPGWQRAPNPAAAQGGEDGGYPYYYYHTKTRITRWDPPVYPWDADPEDNLIPDRPDDDPEAPYNWNCAHRYAVTHEEIEAVSHLLAPKPRLLQLPS